MIVSVAVCSEGHDPELVRAARRNCSSECGLTMHSSRPDSSSALVDTLN